MRKCICAIPVVFHTVHNDLDDLREAAQRLPTLLPAASSDTYPTVRRNRLANLAYTLPPETIDYILSLAIPAKSS